MNQVIVDIKKVGTNLTKNLRSMGVDVSSGQVLNAVAATLGEKTWNSLLARVRKAVSPSGGQTSPRDQRRQEPNASVLNASDLPLDRKALEERGWKINLVIPVHRVVARDASSDALHRYIAKRITGDEDGLTNVSFEGWEHRYDADSVALRVTATVNEVAFRQLSLEGTTEAEQTNPEHWAFYAERTVQATFQRQAWVNDNAIDTAPAEAVDVTRAVLALPLAKLRALEDNEYCSDYLVDLEALQHSGPFYVEVEDAILEFFGVEALADVSDAMLNAARMAHCVNRTYS